MGSGIEEGHIKGYILLWVPISGSIWHSLQNEGTLIRFIYGKADINCMATPDHIHERLEVERIIWLATVRPDGRPHLVPLWFAWHNNLIYICIQPDSVKARNLRQNPRVSLSLEDGDNPVICEGETAVIPTSYPPAVTTIFQQKYKWDITTDADYTQLIAITPRKWLSWGS